jgi:hypothetical protein
VLILPPSLQHRTTLKRYRNSFRIKCSKPLSISSNHLTIKAKGWHPVLSSALALLVSLFSCNLAVADVPAVLVCIDIAGDLSTAGVPALASPFFFYIFL